MDETKKSKRLTSEQRAVVSENMALATFVCSQPKFSWVTRFYVTWEDAISQAMIGLCKAARTWDGKRKFSPYAVVCIFRELVQGALRRINYQQKTGRAEVVSFGYNDHSHTPDYRSGSNPADKEWADDTLGCVLRHLDAKYRETVKLLIANHVDHAAVGEELGISRSAVSQRLREIKKKIRRIGITA